MYRPTKNSNREQLLKIANNLLEALDCSDEGILIVDIDTKIHYANKALKKYLGVEKKDIEGRNFREFMSQDESKTFDDVRKATLKSGSLADRTITFKQKKTGRVFEILFQPSSGNTNYFLIYFKDATKRTIVENRLREANAFYNALIDNSVDSIVAADMKGNIILFNRGAQDLLHYTEEEAKKSLHTTRLYQEGEAKEIMRRMRSDDYGGKGKCIKHRVVALTKEGQEIPISISGSIIHGAHGEEIASVGIFTDLREFEAMQERLNERQFQLIQSEKMAALGKLAAGVAHEINNPLSGVLIFANLVEEDLPEDSPQREDVQRIISETTRCKTIVRELLDFARQDEQGSEEADINHIIEEGIRLIQNQAIFHNVEVILDLQPGLPPVYGSALRLNQVLLNLIFNGAEAMEGSGTLTVSTKLLPNNQQVEIRVEDTGVGIDSKIRNKIFDPFFTTKEVGKGTGLGLSVSYRIIKDCGGDIQVESGRKGGAAFVITVPVKGTDQLSAQGEVQ